MNTAEEKKQENRNADHAHANEHLQKPKLIEWIAGGVSAVITLAMVGFLFYEAIGVTAAIPRLSVETDEIRPTDEAFQVHFRVVNQGDATAAGVLVRGRLEDGQVTVEEKQVTLDYVPAHSEQQGALLFNNDPRGLQLQIEPDGYMKP